MRNVEVQDLTCERGKYALYLRGYEDAPIRDVRLARCRFSDITQDNVLENVENLVLEDVVVNGTRPG